MTTDENKKIIAAREAVQRELLNDPMAWQMVAWRAMADGTGPFDDLLMGVRPHTAMDNLEAAEQLMREAIAPGGMDGKTVTLETIRVLLQETTMSTIIDVGFDAMRLGAVYEGLRRDLIAYLAQSDRPDESIASYARDIAEIRAQFDSPHKAKEAA